MFNIGEIVWYEGKKWQIADSYHNTYALQSLDGKRDYGYKSDGSEDKSCPFSTEWTHGFVPAKYLSKETGE